MSMFELGSEGREKEGRHRRCTKCSSGCNGHSQQKSITTRHPRKHRRFYLLRDAGSVQVCPGDNDRRLSYDPGGAEVVTGSGKGKEVQGAPAASL